MYHTYSAFASTSQYLQFPLTSTLAWGFPRRGMLTLGIDESMIERKLFKFYGSENVLELFTRSRHIINQPATVIRDRSRPREGSVCSRPERDGKYLVSTVLIDLLEKCYQDYKIVSYPSPTTSTRKSPLIHQAWNPTNLEEPG
jgi:hypothetical protein